MADAPIAIDDALTAEECELLQALADGCTINEYAEKGGLNLNTTNHRLSAIRKKFDVATTYQALATALRRGIID